MNNFQEYLIQHYLKSGGTKDHFRRIKVPGTAPYWKACKSLHEKVIKSRKALNTLTEKIKKTKTIHLKLISGIKNFKLPGKWTEQQFSVS